MPLPYGLGQDPLWTELITALSEHFDENQRVQALGVRAPDGAGTTVELRFLAAPACAFVQVHVQHDGAGGGGASYNSGTFVSTDRIDCRTARQQDRSIARNGTDHYYVWLVPVWAETDASYTKFDGTDESDQMAFVDLGV